MARNTELVRQWDILRAIDGARNGIAVPKLAAERGVHQRTIRRDIDALCRAGFPLYDEKVNGTSMWKLRMRPFQRLEETGLGVTELCALYLGRTMLAALAATPLADEAERAFVKIERALPLKTRRFLDQLPCALKVKAAWNKKHDERKLREVLPRVFEAVLSHRRVEMSYASLNSASPHPHGRVPRTYVIEPHRIAYAHGGVYLIAWVPAYHQMRTFATERILTFAVMDERFESRPLPAEPFGNSLGVNTAEAEEVAIAFTAEAAPYVREREWHRSQHIEERQDGSIVMTLTVCDDYALRSWILGFGPAARVVAPASLVRDISGSIDAMRREYATGTRSSTGRMRMLSMTPESDGDGGAMRMRLTLGR